MDLRFIRSEFHAMADDHDAGSGVGVTQGLLCMPN